MLNIDTDTPYGDLPNLIPSETSTKLWKNCLITGSTGFLGSFFLYWRLQLPGKSFALIRADSKELAFTRARNALDKVASYSDLPKLPEELLSKKLVCLVGDVAEENCGLGLDAIDLLAKNNITNVWHIASSLAFSEKHRNRLMRINLGGTQNLLELSKSLHMKKMIYVSTGYTSGSLQGKIKEELHPTTIDFANCYEESKCLAEHTVVNFCDSNEMTYNIARPTMIVGLHSNFRSGGTEFGPYGFSKEIAQKVQSSPKESEPIRIVGDYTSTLNMIPVDHVVFDLLRIANIDKSDIFHLSNPSNYPLGRLLDNINSIFGYEATRMVNKRHTEPTTIEKALDRRTKFYSGYYHTKKEFVRSLPIEVDLSSTEVASFQKEFLSELLDLY